MTTPENTERALAEKLAQVADKRREAARAGLEKTKVPDFILEIIQTEVQYVISPRLLPYAQADMEAFSEKLKSLYGLTRVEQDLSRYSNTMALLGADRPSALEFQNGRFKISAHDFVAIKALRLTYEGVHLVLTGPSSVADTVVPDVVEQLWDSAGVAKPWKEVEPYIQLKAFGCGTLADLGFPLTNLLSAEFRDVLDKEFIRGKQLAAAMSPLMSTDKFQVNVNQITSYVVDDINLMFNTFNPVSGQAYQVKLRLNVEARHTYGSSICEVISELPFEKHVDAIQVLRERFAAT